jgi:ATP-dependent DNA helicase RecQ
MLGLCEVSTCRRQVLLRYFGDTLESACGNCDNCLDLPEEWDGSDAARMALSCVYRTGQRFGSAHLIDVLRGVSNDRVLSFDHHRVSTFGIGKAIAAEQWRSVLRQLVARGLLDVDPAGHGGLRLTGAAKPVLRGEERVWLRRDRKTGPAERATGKRDRNRGGDVVDAARPLWDALRACRKRLAEAQNVPPYVIFHDATLRAMLELRPRNAEELRAVSGVGDSKLERYGEAFLAVLREARD